MSWLDIKYFINKYQVGTYMFFSLLVCVGLSLLVYGTYSISRPVYVTKALVENINCEGTKCLLRISYVEPTKNDKKEIFLKLKTTQPFKIGDYINIGMYRDDIDSIFLYNREEQLFYSILSIVLGFFIIISIIFVWWKS